MYIKNLLLLLVPFYLPGFLKMIEPREFDEGWTGIISYSYNYKDKGSREENKVINEWNFYRYAEIRIVVNGLKGRATMWDKMKRWEKTTAPFGQQQDYVQITDVFETGNGAGEVEVSVEMEEDGTYWLKTNGPQYRSENKASFWSSTGLASPEEITTRENDGIPIDAPDQRVGSSKIEISGRYEIHSSPTHFVVVNWNLKRKRAGSITTQATPVSGGSVILVVNPKDYKVWKPEAGNNTETPGNILKVDLELQSTNSKAPTQRIKHFELRLLNTTSSGQWSREVVNPDLKFLEQAGARILNQGMFIMFPCADGRTGHVNIGSYHNKASGILIAEGVLYDGSRIRGRLLNIEATMDIPVPYSENW